MNFDLIQHHLKKSGLFATDNFDSLVIEPMQASTNEIYRVTDKNCMYVIKIPIKQVNELIDKNHENYVSQFTAEAGINLPFLYYDVNTGISITSYINPVSLLYDNAFLSKIAQIFKKLHSLPQPFKKTINIFEIIRIYRNKISENNLCVDLKINSYDDLLLEWEDQIASMHVMICPCHNDPVPDNFLISQNQNIYLIDWEYAGNNDPFWDLAVFALEASLDWEQQSHFLTQYLQRNLTSQEKRRYQIYTVVSHYLWAVWAIVIEKKDIAIERLKTFDIQSQRLILKR